MDRPLENRHFWQIYTPRNIKNEFKVRVNGLLKRKSRAQRGDGRVRYDPTHAASVGHFYDRYHDKFLRAYGDVIQAFRTKDITHLLNYQIRSIGFEAGQRVLDAGCGVGAPAIYFAKHADVTVDALTISRTQCEMARQKIENAGLADRVHVLHGDYHNLEHYFPKESYDVLYFLESFGHSRDKTRAIDSCWQMLKPGGTLYIKDLFRRIPLRAEIAPLIDREIRKINECYRYDVGDLNVVLTEIRRRGFILTVLKSIDLDLEQFEDLAISNEFQELTGLARIENWEDYVFPVDFFEIKCTKPEFKLDERLDRHFLQNRYHQRFD